MLVVAPPRMKHTTRRSGVGCRCTRRGVVGCCIRSLRRGGCFRVLLRLDTFALGKCRPPLLDDVKRRTSLRREFTVAVDRQRPKDVAEFVNEFEEGGFLYWGHGVLGFALVDSSDVAHPDGVVVAFGVCARAPNGSSSRSTVPRPSLRMTKWYPMSDQFRGGLVCQRRIVSVVTCCPFSVAEQCEDNFGRLHASTSCLSHKPTARKKRSHPTPPLLLQPFDVLVVTFEGVGVVVQLLFDTRDGGEDLVQLVHVAEGAKTVRPTLTSSSLRLRSSSSFCCCSSKYRLTVSSLFRCSLT